MTPDQLAAKLRDQIEDRGFLIDEVATDMLAALIRALCASGHIMQDTNEGWD